MKAITKDEFTLIVALLKDRLPDLNYDNITFKPRVKNGLRGVSHLDSGEIDIFDEKQTISGYSHVAYATLHEIAHRNEGGIGGADVHGILWQYQMMDMGLDPILANSKVPLNDRSEHQLFPDNFSREDYENKWTLNSDGSLTQKDNYPDDFDAKYFDEFSTELYIAELARFMMKQKDK